MLDFAYRVYRQKLEREVAKGPVPSHIVVVISPEEFLSGAGGVIRFVEWCGAFGVREITFAIDGNPEVGDVAEVAERIPGRIRLITRQSVREFGGGGVRVNINLGVGGREEILNAIRSLAEDVVAGKVDPDEVGEEDLGKRLVIRSEPDVILRAGLKAKDFLVWQGIYSEHVFFDLDWKSLRYIDFLRILREYQKRERRYGR
ncbi:MAG: undecaprenyl diphosphate synthase family protein [Archaeoglobi archaeon]|nr:undecaprenyl diphosphate synthase family protein [Archaeoglobi archaeon]